MGKWLMGMGALLLVVGGLLTALSRVLPGWRLPGDIYIHRGNFTFYFPIVTSLLLSLALTVFLTLVSFIFRR